MRKILLLSCLLCIMLPQIAYANNDYFTVHDTDTNGLYVTYKNSIIDFGDTQPFINDYGVVQVPIRITSEILDKEVKWIEDAQSVIIHDEDNLIRFKIGSNIMYMNDDEFLMEDIANIVDSCAYVPLNFVSDAFGIQVWYTPNENNIPDGLLDIEVKSTDITIKDIADYLYSQGALLEDQRDGMVDNIIKEKNVYRNKNIPYDYKAQFENNIAIISESETFTIDEVRKRENLNFSAENPLNLSSGMVEFCFKEDSSAYQYETRPIEVNGGSILIDYFPQNPSFANPFDERVVIYLMAYDRETGTGPFKVGYVHCSYGERMVAKVDGLRKDREYMLKILNDKLFGQDEAVIRMVSLRDK